MQEQFTANVSVCVDCVMCIEYGTSMDSAQDAEFKAGMQRWGAKAAYTLSDEADYFSRSPCDICDSTFAGTRMDVVIEYVNG